MAKKRAGNSQGLSPTALKRKRARDKAAAMSSWGKYKKRTAQAKKCKKEKIMTMLLVNVYLRRKTGLKTVDQAQ